MKVSELIMELQDRLDAYGDVDVKFRTLDDDYDLESVDSEEEEIILSYV